MNKALCLVALFAMALTPAYAQVTLNGKVIDASTNNPIQGATVSTSNSGSNSVTDNKGNFTLNITSVPDSINLTSTGYIPKKIAVEGSEVLVSLHPSFTHLNEIVVTAGRQEQRRTEVPIAIHVISKASINETKATRLDMLINKVPGVFMVDLGNEQHSMSVRQPLGYKNLFLYLEDGIPIRTVGDFNHNALIEINHASLERIEVIKGPASSLYGSEAVGGAVNFITQSPSQFLSAKVQGETGSGGYKRTDFNISNTYKKAGFFLGGYYADQNQPDDEHNDFRKASGMDDIIELDYSNPKMREAMIDAMKFWVRETNIDGADTISPVRVTFRQVANLASM